MKNVFLAAGWIVLLAVAVQCTEPIRIDTDQSPPVIVIYGTLTDDWKFQRLTISRSSPYFDPKADASISAADVVVRSSNNRTYRFEEDDSIKGLYCSSEPFAVQKNVTYSLSVHADLNNDGVVKLYEASTTVLPATTEIDSLTLEPVEIFGRKNHILYLHAMDSPEEDYYLFRISYNDSLLHTSVTQLVVSDDKMFNNQYLKGNLYNFVDISEKEKDTGNDEQRVYLKPGDRIAVEMSLIPRGYYDFINQCRQGIRGENPMFGGPPSNIITNIQGGAGYFTGYRILRKGIVFEPESDAK